MIRHGVELSGAHRQGSLSSETLSGWLQGIPDQCLAHVILLTSPKENLFIGRKLIGRKMHGLHAYSI